MVVSCPYCQAGRAASENDAGLLLLAHHGDVGLHAAGIACTKLLHGILPAPAEVNEPATGPRSQDINAAADIFAPQQPIEGVRQGQPIG